MKPTPNDVEEIRELVNRLVNSLTGMEWSVSFHLHNVNQDTSELFYRALAQGFQPGEGDMCQWASSGLGTVIFTDIPGSNAPDNLYVPNDI